MSSVSSVAQRTRSYDESEPRARRLFALSCKSLPTSDISSEIGDTGKLESISSDLSDRYSGLEEVSNYRLRLRAGESYRPKEDEVESHSNLILHRQILLHYAELFDGARIHPELGEGGAFILQSLVKAAEAEASPTGMRALAKLKKQIVQAEEGGSLRLAELLPTLKSFRTHFTSKSKDVEEMIAEIESRINDLRVNMEALVSRLYDHIGRLSDPQAIDVVTDRHGRRFFCIPGGVSDSEDSHAIVYEFAKELDGTYSFVIYNKGDGSEDPDLHGEVEFQIGYSIIGRTRVQILGLKQEDLQNRRFLKRLCELKVVWGKTMEDINLEIKSYLIDTCRGVVFQSPLEEQWLFLSQKSRILRKDKWRKREIERQLLADPNFHRKQQWGSCYESNAQTPEHSIISSPVRKKLKLHEIEHTVQHLGPELRHHPELRELAHRKIAKLRSKIHQ